MIHSLVGQPVPEFTLTAVTSRAEVSRESTAGTPLVLIFVGQSSAPAATAVNAAVRARLPSPAEARVATIIDLRGVPGFMKGMAEGKLAEAYENAALMVPSEFAAEDYVLILPDWDGAVCRQFEISDPDGDATVVVVGADGTVKGVAPAADAAAAAALVGD